MSISDAALQYAILGWHLVPIKPRGKRPRINGWQHQASCDPDVIRQWFTTWPDSNLGLRLGPQSNAVDVEADDDDGKAKTEQLLAGCMTPTWDSARGTHRLFQFPDDLIIDATVQKPQGIEIRLGTEKRGAQSVIPPSIHRSGKQLQWRPGLSPFDVSLQPFPDSLRQLLLATDNNGGNGLTFEFSSDTLETADGALEGQRNKTLCILVGSYLKDHGADSRLLPLAMAFAARCQPPYPEAEAVKTVQQLVARHCQKTGAVQPVAVAKPRPLRFIPFPVHVLPSPLNEFATAAANSVSCDESFIALPVLAACASAIGNSVRFAVKPDWSEPSMLWAGIVGPPGDRKTPAINAATEPLLDIQTELQEAYEDQQQQYNATRLRFEVELKQWKARAAKSQNPEAPPLLVEGPAEPRTWCDDATVEALGVLLAGNPRGLLLRKDELTAWLKSFGEYKGKGGDLQRWLSIHNASPVVIDRKGSDSIHLRVPNVSICGGIQPGLLQSFFLGEHVQAGLMQRFLFAWPPSKPAKLSRHGIGRAIKEEYASLLKRLQQVPFEGTSAEIPLSEDAWEAFEAWHDDIEQVFKPSVDGILREVGSKLTAAAVRLAGIVHCIADGHGMEISADSMRTGIVLASWFRDEWQRVHDLQSESPEQQASRQLVDFIRSKPGGRITPRDLNRGKRQVTSSDQAEQILRNLAAQGWGIIQDRPAGEQGGRPTFEFILQDDVDETPVFS